MPCTPLIKRWCAIMRLLNNNKYKNMLTEPSKDFTRLEVEYFYKLKTIKSITNIIEGSKDLEYIKELNRRILQVIEE